MNHQVLSSMKECTVLEKEIAYEPIKNLPPKK